MSPEKSASPSQRITIIPPDKDKIVSAIEKIYDVIKTLDKNQDVVIKEEKNALNTLNRRLSFPKSDYRDNLQDCKIEEMGSREPNDPLTGTKLTSKSANIINTKAQEISILAPNLDCFDHLTSGYSCSSFNDFNINTKDIYNDQDGNGLQFHTTNLRNNFFQMAQLPEESNFIQILPERGMTNLQTGTKRPSDFEDEEMLYKKKIGMAKEGEISNIDSQNLQNFFDETRKHLINNSLNFYEYSMSNQIAGI